MADMVTANLHEVGELVKIAWPFLKYGIEKGRERSKQREALADCNSRLDDCKGAVSRCETQRRVLAYVFLFAFAALLVGSIFFTIAPRSRL